MKLFKILSIILIIINFSHGNYKFVQLTDLHADFFYKAGADLLFGCQAGQGKCGKFGTRGFDCDSPIRNAYDTIKFLSEIVKGASCVFQTGDIIRHDSDTAPVKTVQSVHNETKLISKAIKEAIGNIPLIPNIGNNDISPHNALAAGPNEMLDALADSFSPFLSKEEIELFKMNGAISRKFGKKFRILSINSIYFYKNPYVRDCHHSGASRDHMEWLESELANAKLSNERVIILGHVPPNNFRDNCYDMHNQLIKKYSKIIAANIYGHTHNDMFLMFMDKDIPYQYALVGPSGVSSYNSAVRVYEFDEDNLIDFTTYYYSLEKAHKDDQIKYIKEYSAKEAYNMSSMSVESFYSLYKEITDKPESSRAKLYEKYNKVSSESKLISPEQERSRRTNSNLQMFTAIEPAE